MNRMALIALLATALVATAWADPPATTQPADELGELDDLFRPAEQGRQPGQDQPEPGAGQPPTGQPDQQPAEEEENDLATLLLKKAGGEGRKPIMMEVLENMGLSREQLREKFDPGTETQKIQQRIIKDLDKAIEMAQQASSSSSSSSQSQQQGQGQRQQSRGSGQGQQGGPPQTNRGNQAASESVASHGQVQHGQRNPDIVEGRAEWGALPPRDREEVVQGQNEEALPRWRALIEKYYTALQVQSQSKD